MKKLDLTILFILALSILIFIGLPFFYVFKEAVIIDGQLSLSLVFEIFSQNKKIFLNSILLGVLSSSLVTLASLAVGVYSYLSSKRVRKIISAVLMLTMISPPFVTSLSYISLFGRRGLISYGLFKISHSPYGLQGIVLMQALGFLSLSSLMIISSLNQINIDEIKSARDLGADSNHIILDVILPQLKLSLVSVFFLSFIRSLADFGTPAIIGGNFNVLASKGYMAVISKGNIKEAAVLNIMILIPSIVLFYIYSKAMTKDKGQNNSSPDESYIEKKGYVYWIIRIISVFFLTWLLVQYFSIILSAFTRMSKGKLIFSLENFIETKPYINSTIIRSIVYSLISAIIGSFIGLLIAYYSIIRKSKLIGIIDYLANLPYILPGTFFGLGYLLAFNHKPIYLIGTSAIVVLNVLFKQLPFSSKVMKAHVSGISMETVNSARDLGANFTDEFVDIIYPLSKNGLFVSFINAFTATMTTVGSIIFLIHPGQKVLTLVMFDVINSGNYNIGSVIALVIIIICLIVNGIYYILNRRSGENVIRN